MTHFILLARFTFADTYKNTMFLSARRGPNAELALSLAGKGGVPMSMSNLNPKRAAPAFCEADDFATVAAVEKWFSEDVKYVFSNIEKGPSARKRGLVATLTGSVSSKEA